MLKLNVGFNRKAGEANYGSRGASVNLELELDSSLAGDSERLKDRIRSLFLLAKASVDEELTSGGSGNGHAGGRNQAAPSGNGHSARGRRDGTRSATASQVRALHAIADRQGIDLAEVVRTRYGVDQPEAISITEASGLIDELKDSGNHGSNGGGR
jgi:hypothetical protein